MRVRFAVPRRPDGGRRDQLWAFCSAWWTERFPDWEIATYDHDPTRPFNRGASINYAASGISAQGPWDVLVVLDGDVLADEAQVQAAVERAAETGRACFAFDEYVPTERPMADKILAGFNGRWVGRTSTVARSHVSSILAVPRALWERTGGFDERCEGWGQDDTIFAHVCRVLGGGIERIEGKVYHLWHAPSPHARSDDPYKLASDLLAQRYFTALDPDAIRAIVAEREVRDGVSLVVMTDGRRECIETTIGSALENLKGYPIVGTWICDDSADIDYAAWLRLTFPDAHVLTTPKRLGFAGAVRRAQAVAIAAGQPWVFWLEDDFETLGPIDLSDMAAILRSDDRLTQVMLRRQAWFPVELEVGGFVEMNPDAYEDRSLGDLHWLEHSLGHWTNPHLTSRDFLINNPWPKGLGSERAMGIRLRREGRRMAVWGRRTDPPTIHHSGERKGTGY